MEDDITDHERGAATGFSPVMDITFGPNVTMVSMERPRATVLPEGFTVAAYSIGEEYKRHSAL